MTKNESYRVTSPAPRDVWHELLQTDPDALITQTPEWLDCICAESGYQDASRLYEMRNGGKLILPLVRRSGVPTSLAIAASLPVAWGIGGLIGSRTITQEDVEIIYEDLAHIGYLAISVRPNPLHGNVWASARPGPVLAVPRLAHVLDLSGGFDEVWTHRFHQRTRRGVRKAEKSGLDVKCDTTGELVPVFYELFEQSLVRWAHHQHEPIWLARWRGRRRDSLHKLHTIAETLGDACRIWVAWYNGKPAASIIVLQGAHNAHYTRGAMDYELAKQVDANDLLHKLAIEDACQSGCRYYHMGETGFSESLAQFKSRFGAVAYPYAEYHYDRIPISRWNNLLRSGVKHMIGFRDV
jgi:hypothetical protein